MNFFWRIEMFGGLRAAGEAPGGRVARRRAQRPARGPQLPRRQMERERLAQAYLGVLHRILVRALGYGWPAG